MKKISLILLSVIVLISVGCKTNNNSSNNNSNKQLSPQEKEIQLLNDYIKNNNIKESPKASGLYYIETLAGKGEQAIPGKTVSVHYTGKLIDGTVFDSTEGGEPFEFTLGAGQVIKGWDEGISYMKEGGKAILIIPSKIGYGSRNIEGIIPSYSTLIFEVELVDVK